MGIIFTLAGVLMFYFFGLPPLKYAFESKSWPSTEGTITKSEVETWMKDGKTQYGALIAYTYQVEGKAHISHQVGVNSTSSNSNMSAVKSLVQEYPVGTMVDVYYDPEVPDSAALIPGVRAGDVALAGGMLLFAIIGLLVLFRIIKPTRSYSNTTSRGGRIDVRELLKR
ncbi:MAG: DUF3592 domain-containing protein [Bacteroides sp.]|nr:DUF3592 domain-containing protein [Bacteroides sp.]